MVVLSKERLEADKEVNEFRRFELFLGLFRRLHNNDLPLFIIQEFRVFFEVPAIGELLKFSVELLLLVLLLLLISFVDNN